MKITDKDFEKVYDVLCDLSAQRKTPRVRIFYANENGEYSLENSESKCFGYVCKSNICGADMFKIKNNAKARYGSLIQFHRVIAIRTCGQHKEWLYKHDDFDIPRLTVFQSGIQYAIVNEDTGEILVTAHKDLTALCNKLTGNTDK